MVSAHDVAAYIIRTAGPTTAMKLQKLVYYSQAWSLVWEGQPLFAERIEAWANGPVVPELFALHRGQFMLASWPQGDADRLDQVQRQTVDSVLGFYGQMNSQQLSDLTHAEDPWLIARRGVPDGARGASEISHASMEEYYSSLPAGDAA